MMIYIKPKKIMTGDLMGIIAPASSPENKFRVKQSIKYLQSKGYKTTLGKSIDRHRGYLAGTDDERVADIHQMFMNENVKAIFCLRGGYGAFRLLDKLDYKLISDNAKIFVGFSEITALHMAFLKKAKLITFAGPMLIPNFSKDINPYTEKYFWDTLTTIKKRREIRLKRINRKSRGGYAKDISGKMIGGNLAVFSALLGTQYFPDLRDSILFLEEISETPYKIDRMLNQLKLNDVFSKVNGIVLGSFYNCKETDKKKSSLTLEEVLQDYFAGLSIPVYSSLPFGHVNKTITIPIGVKANLIASKNIIEFFDNGLK